MTKQAQYLQHIQQAEQQKLSLAEYARQNGISVQHLYAARYNVPKTPCETPSAFVPVQFTPSTGIRIALPNGVNLYVAEVTEALLRYLAALPCSV